MKNRIILLEILVSICVLSILFLGCSNGDESGKSEKSGEVYRSVDGRVQKLELYDEDLKIVYNFDAFESVESALVYRGETLIAKAEEVGTSSNGPTALDVDIEVEETYFSPKTGDIVYKGRLVFRCRANVEMGERIEVKPILGERPQDLFLEWPYIVMY